MTDAAMGADGIGPIRKLLAVCAGAETDDRLLAAAAVLADRTGAHLVLFSVVETPPDARELARAANIDLSIAMDRMVVERRAAVLESAGRVLGDGPATVEIQVGKAFIEIIRHVIEGGFDFVLKTAEPLRGARRFVFASTDQHLLRKCPCPVWLRQPDAPPRVGKVLAAVDVDLEDAAEPETLASLNAAVMQTAARLVPGKDAEIDVLHAWDAPGEGLVRLWSNAPDAGAAAEAYVATIHAGRAEEMQRLIGQVADSLEAAGGGRPAYRTVLARGAARAVIAAQCGARRADVLVIGTVARTGLHGVIIGNTAEDILNSIDCSVVAVKPPGFETPLDFSDPGS